MKTLKTIKYTLIITLLILLTTSCTDLTEDLVPETKTQNTELVTGINDLPENDSTSLLPDTGGNTGTDNDGGKGN